MKKIFTLFAIVILGLSLSSCQDFLNINKDPNKPTADNMTNDMVFPAAELTLASVYGDYLRIVGGMFSQHYAQDFGTSNYLGYSKFDMYSNQSSGFYTRTYTQCLSDLQYIIGKATEEEAWGTVLAATTLKAFAFQVLVDAYGEVPYSEAFDPSNTAPKYDEGAEVYAGILKELDDALAQASESSPVAFNFLFGSSNAAPWIKFANALKLKIYMRESDYTNVSSQVAALVSANNFPADDVAFADIWADEVGKANPFYQEEFATYFGSTQVNICLNLALLKVMEEDGRLPAFWQKNTSGAFTGGVSGSNFSTSQSYKAAYFCRPNAKYNDPVTLISKAEVEFFLAEYEARYGSDASAKAHYEAAVEASFASAGVSGAEEVLAAYPWNKADYKRIIGIQKWVALSNGSNFEAWCELRRLGYPAMGSVTGEKIYNVNTDAYDQGALVTGTLYTPIQYNTDVGAGKILQRFPYAESSITRNANAPAVKKNSEKVFWVK